MNLGQALLYFVREALVRLARSWKVSLVAVLTIAMSLYMGGLIFLVTQNLSRSAERWKEDQRVVVYLHDDVEGDSHQGLIRRIEAPPWVSSIEIVSAAEAMQRFEETFPSLADLFAGWEEEPMPASIEVHLDPQGLAGATGLESWLRELRQDPKTRMVDDDRDWMRQLGSAIAVLRIVGLSLGVILLVAAVFTIASVVKLTAYLYLDEISVMRLVGATEFFIRGPFYSEGLFQGLIGGTVALLALYASFSAFTPSTLATWLPLLWGEFFKPSQQVALVAFGGAAGLFGAVTSLRRESLRGEDDA